MSTIWEAYWISTGIIWAIVSAFIFFTGIWNHFLFDKDTKEYIFAVVKFFSITEVIIAILFGILNLFWI